MCTCIPLVHLLMRAYDELQTAVAAKEALEHVGTLIRDE